ncbi:MsnO8 family LLM class oxidoreductase [Pseudomonas alloputida]|uniref:MsnO8 family LLM class oxidoreductase n=1 Tax=Pseudomonas TaxID=286 RepID=UPI003EEBBF23
MTVTLRLTIIDQTPIHEGWTGVTAPTASVDLAIECEKAGYYRYWLAEHHNSIQFAGSAPEILLTRIASATSRIRVGSGGVMLTHYSPYKVAETFAVIGGLFPGRIDLGIGRAPGGNHLSSLALASPRTPTQHDHFPGQAADLCAFIRSAFPANHPYSGLSCSFSDASMPSLWMLGSGGGSSHLAGQLGMGLALAKFIAPRVCSPDIFRHHSDIYQRAGHISPAPHLLALAVICAASDEEAKFIACTAVYRKMMAGAAAREALLSPEEVQKRYQQMNRYQQQEFDETMNDMVIGSPKTCLAKIQELAMDFECHEIGILTVTYSLEDRVRSYQLLANALTAGTRSEPLSETPSSIGQRAAEL